MANTYTQIFIQLIFAVKGRENLVKESFRDELEKYMCGIIREKQQKALAIYCNPDHTHILIGMKPTITIAEIMRDIKSNSSILIKEKGWAKKFNWQDGYGAFSYSKSHVDTVVKYILNQPKHHKKKSFREEYLEFLDKFKVDYDERYLFDWI